MSNDNDQHRSDDPRPGANRARPSADVQPDTEQLRIVGAEEAATLMGRGERGEGGEPTSAFASVADRPRPARRAVFESIPDAQDLDELPLRGERWGGGEADQDVSTSSGNRTPAARAVESGSRRVSSGARAGADLELEEDEGVAPNAFDDEDFDEGRRAATGTRSGRRASPADEESDLELPHWTVPPTGQVPRVLANERRGDEAWSTFGASPRWRGEGGGAWNDDADDLSDLADDVEEDAAEAGLEERPAIDRFFAVDEGDEPVGDVFTRSGSRAARRAERDRARGTGEQLFAVDTGATRAGPTGPVGTVTPGRRNVPAAVLLGLGLAALAIALFRVGPAATMLLVLAVVGVGAAEFFDGSRRGGYRPATLLGLAGSLGLPAAVYWRGEIAYPIVLGLVMLAGLLWFLFGVDHEQVAADLGITVLGVLYVGGLSSFAALILRVPDVDTTRVLLGAVVAVVAHDVLAYVVGSNAGRTPLMAHVSPHKTVEGLLGGSLGAVIASVIFNQMLGTNPWVGLGLSLQLGFVVALLGPLGDLTESLLKRDFGVKDMGTILPGHGGMLDRFDTLLFCLPGVYYLALWRDVIPG
ncbi:MAG: phosphatidate cytidylyltransferase [Acidimicrobiales bacterium]